MTTDQLIDLAVSLFADALARGDVQLANDAAGIALDLTAQVRYAGVPARGGRGPVSAEQAAPRGIPGPSVTRAALEEVPEYGGSVISLRVLPLLHERQRAEGVERDPGD